MMDRIYKLNSEIDSKEAARVFDEQKKAWESKKREMRRYVAEHLAEIDRAVLVKIIEDYCRWKDPDDYAFNVLEYLREVEES